MNKPEQIATQLGKAKQNASGWLCCCPAHADQHPSLAITEKEGKVLFHCYAGCSQEAVLSALRTQNLWGVFDRDSGSGIEQTYDYRNENGNIVFQKLRKFGKRFSIRHPEPGGYAYNLKGVRRVLYKLPEILKQKEKQGWIFLVEGEKDVDRLYKEGLVSTTNFEGAGKWKAEYSEQLLGASVVILGDNDEPGQKHIELVKSELERGVAHLKIVKLPLEMHGKPVKDVSDWFDAGGKAEGLTQLVKLAQDVSKKHKTASLIIPKIKIHSAEEFLTLPFPPTKCILGGWFEEGMPILISAPTKCGKSLFGYWMMHSLSLGQMFFHWECPEAIPTAILDGEMRPATIQRRLVDMALSSKRQLGNLKIVCRETFTWANEPFPDLRKIDQVTSFLDSLEPVKVLLLDNINCWFPGGNENNPDFWHPIEVFAMECRKRGIACVMIHHNSKSNPNSPSGSSKSERIPEVVIVLQKIGESAGAEAHFNVKFRHLRETSEDVYDFSAKLIKDPDGSQSWVTGQYAELSTATHSGTQKDEARLLQLQGKSYREIGEKLGIAHSTIGSWLKTSEVI